MSSAEKKFYSLGVLFLVLLIPTIISFWFLENYTWVNVILLCLECVLLVALMVYLNILAVEPKREE